MKSPSRSIKTTTLCCVVDSESRLLMILKKRGQGAGKWNVPGGKVHQGERVEDAASRECLEETGIVPADLQEVGLLEFYFAENSPASSWDNICHVFVSSRFSGKLQEESEECSAHWVPVDRIPYEQMWEDDSKWLPLALSRKRFHLVCRFDETERLVSCQMLTGGTNTPS